MRLTGIYQMFMALKQGDQIFSITYSTWASQYEPGRETITGILFNQNYVAECTSREREKLNDLTFSEADGIVLAERITIVVWLEYVLQDLDIRQSINSNAENISGATNGINSEPATNLVWGGYIHMKCNYIMKLTNTLFYVFVNAGTKEIMADFLTKPRRQREVVGRLLRDRSVQHGATNCTWRM